MKYALTFLISALCFTALAANQTNRVAQQTTMYRNNSAILMDSSFVMGGEDGDWGVTAAQIRTALTGGGSGGSGQTNNTVLAAGTSVTIVTNVSGARTLYTVSSSGGAGGGGTNSIPIPLSFSGTNVAIDCTTPLGCITNAPLTFTLTMTTNALLQNPTGMQDGQRVTIVFLQDATGRRLAFFDTKWGFGTDITGATLTATAAKLDFLTAIYKSSVDKWYVVGFARGY